MDRPHGAPSAFVAAQSGAGAPWVTVTGRPRILLGLLLVVAIVVAPVVSGTARAARYSKGF